MEGNDMYSNYLHRGYDFDITFDENDNKVIYSSNVRLIFRSTKDSLASVSVERNARGNNYQNAKERAGNIEYDYSFNNNELLLDAYFLTDAENKFRDQEVEITLYLPEGSIVNTNDNTYSFHSNYSHFSDILDNGLEEHYLKVIDDGVICLDCSEEKSYKVKIDIKNDNAQFKLDTDGLEIKDEDSRLKINRDSIIGETESVKTTIDSSGINIKSKDN